MRGMYLSVAIWSLLFCGFAEVRAQAPPPSEAPNSSEARDSGEARTSEQPSEMMTEQMQQSMTVNTLREQKAVNRPVGASIAVEEISSQACEAAWRIDIDIQQQPARVELERLFAELSLRMSNPEEHAAALDKLVSLQMQNVSRYQAIEQICSQVGFYPDYTRLPDLAGRGPLAAMATGSTDSGKIPVQTPASEPVNEAAPAVVLRAGARPIPLVFAGPFVLEVTRLEEYPPDATGLVETTLFAAGVPGSAQAYWIDDNWRPWSRLLGRKRIRTSGQWRSGIVSIGKWQDMTSSDVIGAIGSRTICVSTAWASVSTRTDLHHLLRGVKSIHLGTEISVPFPSKVETIRFDDLSVTPVTSGGTTPVTIRSVNIRPAAPASGDLLAKDGSATIEIEATAESQTPLICMALDAGGHELTRAPGFGGQMPWSRSPNEEETDHFSGRFNVQGVPKTLIVKVVLEEQQLVYPVELNVPLKLSSEQVEKLAELEFDGPCPVELESLRVTKQPPSHSWQVDVQVTNHSNKSILFLDVTRQYLDRMGNKLQVPTGIQLPERRLTRLLLATPKSTRNIELAAQDAPDELASVQFVLRNITFGDGTKWTPPQPEPARPEVQ